MNVLLSVIDPVAISIGPIKIYWYGIIIALAMLIGISLATKEAQKLGLEEDTMVDMALWAIPIGFIGARLYYVLFKWDYYIQNPSEIIAIWNGGIAIYGGLIAGCGWSRSILVCKKKENDANSFTRHNGT